MAKEENEGQVLARFIIEMMGAPKDHLEKTLRDFLSMLKEDSEVKIVSEHIAEPVPRDKLFTTFAELEIWFKDLVRLFNFCFEAMPSSVEILEPQSLRIDAFVLSGYLNDLQGRLHTLDMALKSMSSEHEVLKRNAEALFRNIIMLSLKDRAKSLAELSQDIGIAEKELEPLISTLMESRGITERKGIYSLGERNAGRA